MSRLHVGGLEVPYLAFSKSPPVAVVRPSSSPLKREGTSTLGGLEGTWGDFREVGGTSRSFLVDFLLLSKPKMGKNGPKMAENGRNCATRPQIGMAAGTWGDLGDLEDFTSLRKTAFSEVAPKRRFRPFGSPHTIAVFPLEVPQYWGKSTPYFTGGGGLRYPYALLR